MAELSEQAKALLEKQRQKYLLSLPDKRADLLSLCKDRDNQPLELIDAVHRIAGSAGLHGLSDLQRAAVSAEQALRDASATRKQQDEALEVVLTGLDTQEAGPQAT